MEPIAIRGVPAGRDSPLSSRLSSRSRLLLAAAGSATAVTSSAARPVAARPASRRFGELEGIMGGTLGWRKGWDTFWHCILGHRVFTKRNLNAGYGALGSPQVRHLYADFGRMR